jgi:hypothetical protein
MGSGGGPATPGTPAAPDEAEEPDEADDTEAPAEEAEPAAPVADSALIPELVALVQEAVAARNADDFIDLLIPAEQERVRPFYVAYFRALSGCDTLSRSLNGVSPNSGAPVLQLAAQLGPSPTADDLRETEAGKFAATGEVNGVQVPHEFESVRGEWHYHEHRMAATDDVLRRWTRAMNDVANELSSLAIQVRARVLSPPEAVSRARETIAAVLPGVEEPPEPRRSGEEIG